MTGQIYVVDRCNHHVQVLNSKLTFSHMFGSFGLGQGQFKGPTDVAVDNEGFVYVADCGNYRIQKFTPEGQFVCSFGTEGSHPAGIMVDDHRMLYVISCDNDNVSVFSLNGKKMCCIKKQLEMNDSSFYGPPFLGITFDFKGCLYVCCNIKGHIRIF